MVPEIDEIRRWLQGHDVDGLPDRETVWPSEQDRGVKPNPYGPQGVMCSRCQGAGEWSGEVCESCVGQGWISRRKSSKLVDNIRSRRQRSGRYVVSADGRDALIMFGKHNGSNISDILKDPDGVGYIEWICREDFPDELKDICRFQMKVKVK